MQPAGNKETAARGWRPRQCTPMALSLQSSSNNESPCGRATQGDAGRRDAQRTRTLSENDKLSIRAPRANRGPVGILQPLDGTATTPATTAPPTGNNANQTVISKCVLGCRRLVNHKGLASATLAATPRHAPARPHTGRLRACEERQDGQPTRCVHLGANRMEVWQFALTKSLKRSLLVFLKYVLSM